MKQSGTNDYTILRRNPDDCLNFLTMAIIHPFFSKFKDIRLYLAKWFFYDVLNVLDRLTELAYCRYSRYEITQGNLRSMVKEALNCKGAHGYEQKYSMFEKICKHPVFFHLVQKPWFWGVLLRDFSEDETIRGCMYIHGLSVWYVSDVAGDYDKLCDLNSEEFLELINKLG